MILMEVFIFRKMSLLSGFWKFILQDDNESYLDCKILTSDNQTVITNKCFLINLLSIYLSDYQDDEILSIMMPFHSCHEIYGALRGFCKTSSPYIVSTELELDQSQSLHHTSVDSTEKRPLEEVRKTSSPYIVSTEFELDQSQSLNPTSVDSREKCPLEEVRKTFLCCDCGKIFSNSKQLKQHKYQGASSLKMEICINIFSCPQSFLSVS